MDSRETQNLAGGPNPLDLIRKQQ